MRHIRAWECPSYPSISMFKHTFTFTIQSKNQLTFYYSFTACQINCQIPSVQMMQTTPVTYTVDLLSIAEKSPEGDSQLHHKEYKLSLYCLFIFDHVRMSGSAT